MAYGIIYCITNKINKKRYVGQTRQKLSARMRSHNYCSKKANPKNYIHRAIKKYGKTQFDIEVLDEADNFEDLNNKEVDWIYILNTIDYGYNLTAGGEGCSVKIGRRHPPEVIAIIVSKNKGQKRTKEQKRNDKSCCKRKSSKIWLDY